MQVSSRVLLVWLIVNGHPRVTAPSPAYSGMLLARSITEFLRYSYFATKLGGGVPSHLTWLRYNTIYVLYPVGVLSEMFLVVTVSNCSEKKWLWMFLGSYLVWGGQTTICVFFYKIRDERKRCKDAKEGGRGLLG